MQTVLAQRKKKYLKKKLLIIFKHDNKTNQIWVASAQISIGHTNGNTATCHPWWTPYEVWIIVIVSPFLALHLPSIIPHILQNPPRIVAVVVVHVHEQRHSVAALHRAPLRQPLSSYDLSQRISLTVCVMFRFVDFYSLLASSSCFSLDSSQLLADAWV